MDFPTSLFHDFPKCQNRRVTRANPIHGQGPALDLLHLSLKGRAKVPSPQKAGRAVLDHHANAEDAFRATLRHCLAHLGANARAAEARQAGGVHQLRVGLRRLRAALTAFGPEFRNPAMEDIRARAQRLARELSHTRELDVFGNDILASVEEAAPSLSGLTAIRQTLDSERQKSWDETVALLRSERFAHFLVDLAHLIDRAAWREGAKDTKVYTQPARRLARISLGKRLAKAKKRAHHLNHLDTDARHRLRITLKKLRYAAEFFAPLFKDKETARFLAKLSKLQDVFGALNDVAGADSMLKKLISEAERPLQKDMQDAAPFVVGWHKNRAKIAWRSAKTRWTHFQKVAPFWA